MTIETRPDDVVAEVVQERVRQIQRQLDSLRSDVDHTATLFPKNAKSAGVAPEGHIHGPQGMVGAGGLVHFDYVVDANWTGPAGTTVQLGTGSETVIYATLTGAIAAIQTANVDATLRINKGTYSEQVALSSSFSASLHVVGEGSEVVRWKATGNSQTIFDVQSGVTEYVSISGIWFDNGTFTGCKGLNADAADVFLKECRFTTGGSSSSTGGEIGSGANSVMVSDCIFGD